MSNKTFKQIPTDSVAMVETDKRDLEFVLAFDQFPEAKTSVHIAEWLNKGHLRGNLKAEYIMCHSTDGASNAVGSAMEFRSITSAVRAIEIRHYTCLAHQVNRSAKYSSGTGDFKHNANERLSRVLNKMHEINGRVYRSEKRLKVLFAVQKEKGRKVIRRPFKGVSTRWNSDHEEVKATNIFMGDYQRSLAIMLGEGGCDAGLLKDSNGDSVEKISLMFSPRDQMIMRQYECGSEPALLLSKFFQMNVPTSHLVLVHLRARIESMREDKFLMYTDISHSTQEVLSNRVKTEVVLSNDVVDRDDVAGGRVETMQQCVAEFRENFAYDMELRSGLTKVINDEGETDCVEELAPDIAIACLLHPMVGGKFYSHLSFHHDRVL